MVHGLNTQQLLVLPAAVFSPDVSLLGVGKVSHALEDQGQPGLQVEPSGPATLPGTIFCL